MSRGTRSTAQTYTLDPASALHVIAWESDGHNGGDMAFGLDGMLYVTSGDGTSDSDTNLRGQDLTQLPPRCCGSTSIIPPTASTTACPRTIRSSARKASCPKPGPTASAIPGGSRSIRKTGHVWVGKTARTCGSRSISSSKGDNYGWSVYEGSHIFYANRKLGPHPLVLPAAEHHHTEARSLTGGVVYHGEKLPELRGAYIYGDYSTGRIWGIKHDGTQGHLAQAARRHARSTSPASASTATASCSSPIIAATAKAASTTWSRRRQTAADSTFPRKLSESGLFASVKEHVMQPGVDSLLRQLAALVRRRAQGAVHRHSRTRPASICGSSSRDKGGWNFPDETVLVKSFALETTAGRSRQPPLDRDAVPHEARQANGSATPTSGTTSRPTPSWSPAEGLDREYEIRVPTSPSTRRPDAADLALSQPHRVHGLPQPGRELRARPHDAADEQGRTTTAA